MTVTNDRPDDGNAASSADFIRLPRKQFIQAMVCVALAMFLGSLGQTIVATALYSIVADIGGFDRYAWVATAYILGATAVAPIAGGLSDLYGRKSLFIVGLSVFIAGSCLSGMSASMNELLAFRALQGVGGGVTMTCSLTALADLIPPQRRGRFQGLMAGVFGIASVFGPVAGGFITDLFSWHGTFFVKFPIAIAILALFVRVYPNDGKQAADQKLDYPGMLLLVCALASLLLALSLGGAEYDWDSREFIGLLTFGLAMAAVFVIVELRTDNPIMSLRMYAEPMMAIAMFIVLLTGFALYGCLLFLPMFFQGVLGLSAASSGNLLVPMLPALVLGAILSGQLLSRTGERYRLHVTCSTALTTLGMYLIATMNSETDVLLIAIYLVLTGFGVGATLSTITVAVQNSTPFRHVGAATAANQFWRTVGGMMGLAVAGAVMTSSFSSELAAVISDRAAFALPEAWLSALQESPGKLLDPATAESLRAMLAQAGSAGAEEVARLFDSLQSALAAALSDVFTVLLVAAGLSFGPALLFRKSPNGPLASQSGK